MVRINPCLINALLPFLAGLVAAATALPADPALTQRQRIEQLLSRCTFGPDAATERPLLEGKISPDRWLETQLHPESIMEPALDAKLLAFAELESTPQVLEEKFPKRNQAEKQEPVDAAPEMQHRPATLIAQLARQKIVRAVESQKQLQEVLADFWFNHFNVDAAKGPEVWLLADFERNAIRPHLFGKFRDLLLATAQHPAMLFYLDNWLNMRAGLPAGARNKQRGINENYARELLELHTLGVDGGYTQKDVIEVARALTGWSIDKPKKNPVFLFRPRAHDEAEKIVLGRKINGGGMNDGLAVIDLLATHPSTARFLATKLCRRFVSDTPPPDCVKDASTRFLATGGDLRETYRAIFRSKAFWSPAAYKAKVKRPFEFVVSSLRALGTKVDPDNRLPGVVDRLGESLYRCQPPTGYKDVAQTWVSSGALVSRLNFALGLARGKMKGLDPPADLEEYLHARSRETSPEAEITSLYGRLSMEPLPAETQAIILKSLDPAQMADGERRPLNRVQLLGMLLGTPEFQRR